MAEFATGSSGSLEALLTLFGGVQGRLQFQTEWIEWSRIDANREAVFQLGVDFACCFLLATQALVNHQPEQAKVPRPGSLRDSLELVSSGGIAFLDSRCTSTEGSSMERLATQLFVQALITAPLAAANRRPDALMELNIDLLVRTCSRFSPGLTAASKLTSLLRVLFCEVPLRHPVTRLLLKDTIIKGFASDRPADGSCLDRFDLYLALAVVDSHIQQSSVHSTD